MATAQKNQNPDSGANQPGTKVKKIFLEHILRPIQNLLSSLRDHFGIGVKMASKNIFLPLVSCPRPWVLVSVSSPVQAQGVQERGEPFHHDQDGDGEEGPDGEYHWERDDQPEGHLQTFPENHGPENVRQF